MSSKNQVATVGQDAVENEKRTYEKHALMVRFVVNSPEGLKFAANSYLKGKTLKAPFKGTVGIDPTEVYGLLHKDGTVVWADSEAAAISLFQSEIQPKAENSGIRAANALLRPTFLRRMALILNEMADSEVYPIKMYSDGGLELSDGTQLVFESAELNAGYNVAAARTRGQK